jgi:hypothetical protein
MMQIFAAVVLTILPGSWILYGLRIRGIPGAARLAMAIALSPAVLGLQLVALEAVGISFDISAKLLVLLNLPAVMLVVRGMRDDGVNGDARDWLACLPLLAALIAIPVLLWSLVPGLRTYEWETMLHTDVIYTIARNGLYVEEVNLAGLSLAYGWVGHSYWSVIGWIGNWAPTTLYPFTNIIWIVVTFVLGYELGVAGLGLHKSTALLGTAFMFLGTNVLGAILRVVMGFSEWWSLYFADIRYSPFLSKFYAFDTMIWGMALLTGLALIYTVALRKRVSRFGSLSAALLTGLGLVYPVLFPAGLVLAGCFFVLVTLRITEGLPEYTRWEIARTGLAILCSAIVVWAYLELMTADRGVPAFALAGRGDIRFKGMRFLGAMGPFILMAALPVIGLLRHRQGPIALLALAAMPLSAVYVGIDLAELEYKYVLAATVCLAFLAAAAMDTIFRRHRYVGWVSASAISAGLVITNLLFVFQARYHIPGNLDQGVPLDESSFFIALQPSNPDYAWTTAIRELTNENTIVIAQKRGVKLSVIVARSMYIPSDLDAGHLPGYNLGQRFYLLEQRGYPTELFDRRLEVVETLYSSKDETAIVQALHSLKELGRPLAIYFPSRDAYLLQWLEAKALGKDLVPGNPQAAWLIDDPGLLP